MNDIVYSSLPKGHDGVIEFPGEYEGPVKCRACDTLYIIVATHGTNLVGIECPKCHEMKGDIFHARPHYYQKGNVFFNPETDCDELGSK